MKLLSTNYDDTLYRFKFELVHINIPALKRFREKGNKLLINTSRPYKSIRKEIDKFSIPYDYLSCFSGRILYDKDGNVIYKCSMEPIEELKQLEEKYEDLTVLEHYFQGSLIGYEISTKKTKNHKQKLKDINSICEKNNLECKDITPNVAYRKGKELYLRSKKFNKATPVSTVSELESIKPKDIYAIGISEEDSQVLKAYQGFTLPFNSSVEARARAEKECISVAHVLRKIKKQP